MITPKTLIALLALGFKFGHAVQLKAAYGYTSCMLPVAETTCTTQTQCVPQQQTTCVTSPRVYSSMAPPVCETSCVQQPLQTIVRP